MEDKTSRWLKERAFPQLRSSFIYFIITLGGVFMLIPFWWMIITAFKPTPEIFSIPITWFPHHPSLANFRRLFQSFSYFTYLRNSSIITAVDTVSSIFFATMAGYGFAKFRVKGASILFLIVLSGLMLPFSVRMIPLYLMMARLNLTDTYLGVMAPNLLSIFGIFLLRQYIHSIPDELIDAARIDGASEFRIFLTIIFPLCTPAIIVLAIFKSLWVWNDFLWPLIMLTEERMMTLTVGLQSLTGYFETLYGPLMAGALLIILPVLIIYIFLARRIIPALATAGLKQ